MNGFLEEDPRFDKEFIEQAFDALSDRLRERGVRATVYIVGGAAIILAHRRSETTLDVDALVMDPRDTVLDAARVVACACGRADDWLNDRVRTVQHMPRRPDKRAITLNDSPYPVMTGASAAYLLAMKVRAGRQSDETDIKNLLRRLDVRTMSEVREIHNALLPNNPLPPRQDVSAVVLLPRVLGEDRKGRAALQKAEERQRRGKTVPES